MHDGLVDAGDNALGYLHRLLLVIQLGQQDHIFVTAHASEGVFVAYFTAQALGNLHQHFIAHRMAEGVVNRLELIQINKQQCQQALAAFRGMHGLAKAVF